MTRKRLRATIEEACRASHCTLKAMTVLADKNDPFRVDTPAHHRNAAWLALHVDNLVGVRPAHLRGLHYLLVTGEVVKPDGRAYTNTDADWVWMSATCAKAARWLGYIPFEQIIDARNSEPVIIVRDSEPLSPYLTVGLDLEVPEVDRLMPRVGIEGFAGVQPYRLVLFGEKTSLEPVLGPLAEDHEADLFLPTGEISDTHLWRMGSAGATDGRRMVVLCFCDCDPAGWQMPISIARKLQAFRALEFPELDFEVRAVGLMPDHVRAYGLPSTPLKPTEKRADDWKAAMRVEQTEIDALAALNPELLRELALEAIAPFYDYTLATRVAAARELYLKEAQARLDEQIDQENLLRLRAEAAAKLDTIRDEIDAINEALRAETDQEFDLPGPVVPQPELNEYRNGLPLIDSDWPWVEQTQRLIASKKYTET
jgi:hypothetical protein